MCNVYVCVLVGYWLAEYHQMLGFGLTPLPRYLALMSLRPYSSRSRELRQMTIQKPGDAAYLIRI